jgi:hypothetical protein
MVRTGGALLFVVPLGTACAAGGAGFESVTSLPEPARHPAGADVDPEMQWPSAERRGSTASGLVVLQTPVAPAAAHRVIAAFFRAVVLESPRDLAALLTRDAVMQNGARREGAVSAWAARFSRFDYATLSGEVIYSDADTKLASDGEDLMVEVPITVTWGTRPRMLGDALTFRLTPNGASWLVAEIMEDFRTP